MQRARNSRSVSVGASMLPAIAGGMLVLSIVPLGAAEDPFKQGLSAYSQGRYEQAFELIQSSARHGSAKGQFLLSTMYRRGLGVDVDEYRGFFWCRKAAEEGLLEAQFQLGLMYLDGEGVTDNESEAMKWLWAAADRGYPQASEVLQYVLSDEYATEYGC